MFLVNRNTAVVVALVVGLTLSLFTVYLSRRDDTQFVSAFSRIALCHPLSCEPKARIVRERSHGRRFPKLSQVLQMNEEYPETGLFCLSTARPVRSLRANGFLNPFHTTIP